MSPDSGKIPAPFGKTPPGDNTFLTFGGLVIDPLAPNITERQVSAKHPLNHCF